MTVTKKFSKFVFLLTECLENEWCVSDILSQLENCATWSLNVRPFSGKHPSLR
jgi:hypothetical protein